MKKREVPKYHFKKGIFIMLLLQIIQSNGNGFTCHSVDVSISSWEEPAHITMLVNTLPHTAPASKADDLFKGSAPHCVLKYTLRLCLTRRSCQSSLVRTQPKVLSKCFKRMPIIKGRIISSIGGSWQHPKFQHIPLQSSFSAPSNFV